MRKVLNLLLILSAFFAFSQNAMAKHFAIVSVSKDQKLNVYEIDENKKSLRILESLETTSRPGAMCVDHDSSHLYVAMKSTGSIAAYRFAKNGKLELINEVAVGADASFVKVHQSGRFLLSSYYRAGQVAVHRIKANGSLSSKEAQIYKTDKNAHSIAVDPSGKFVFVSHTRPNAIFQFRFDSETGKLTKNEPATLIRKERSGPRHLWCHPKNGFAYGSDEQGSSVTAYQLDSATGTLTVLQTLPSLPVDRYDGKNSTSDIEIHPSGDFVYIANRGHDTIAGYSIDRKTGLLKSIQHTSTESITRSFNISPDGKFLVAAGQKSENLALFSIDKNGLLKSLSTIPTGKSPWWVQIIER